MSLNKVYKKVIVDGLSIFFILLFTYAAVNKLQQLNNFITQLEQFPFIGDYATWIAPAVPIMLIIASVLYFIERIRLIAFTTSFFITLLFTIYILGVLNFAVSIPCSCAGLFSSWSWNEQLYLNIGVILLAMVGIALSYWLRKSKKKPTAFKFNIESIES